MHDAAHLTLWEECLLQPHWAALGASCPPVFVTPFEFKTLLGPSGPSSGQDNPARNAQSGHRYSTTASAVHSGMQYGLP